ncbi:MAG TPA: hypothetical protein VMG31_07315 [Verrucomicrobiae bacterium]|nr:hypothetical protein [Verrucomicrobiae bacterium]
MPAASAVPVILREARFSDHAGVAVLMQRYGMDVMSRDDWQNLWSTNPAYLRRNGNWPIGWALEDRNGKIVGFAGNIPVTCCFRGRELTAAVTTAWVVDSDYRNHSLLLASKYFAQKNVDLLLNTTAVHAAGQIFRAFHARPIPLADLETALFWVLDYRGFAASLLARKGVPLAGIARYPVAAGLNMVGWAKGKRLKRVSDSAVRSVNQFDDRFDEFWRELKQQSDVVLSARDRETLQWHFRRSATAKGLWIYTHETRGRLTSYAVFQRQDKSEVGLTRVRLVDFQSLDQSLPGLDVIVAAALERAKAQGVQMLEVIGFAGGLRERLEQMAPFRRKLPSQLFYYKAVAKDLRAPLADSAAWQPGSYDGDSSL